MIKIEDLVQLKAFARQDGAILCLLWFVIFWQSCICQKAALATSLPFWPPSLSVGVCALFATMPLEATFRSDGAMAIVFTPLSTRRWFLPLASTFTLSFLTTARSTPCLPHRQQRWARCIVSRACRHKTSTPPLPWWKACRPYIGPFSSWCKISLWVLCWACLSQPCAEGSTIKTRRRHVRKIKKEARRRQR